MGPSESFGHTRASCKHSAIHGHPVNIRPYTGVWPYRGKKTDIIKKMILPERKSIRLKGYDYSSRGLYFLTIVVHGRHHLFGNIVEGQMCLNAAGEMVTNCYGRIEQRFADVACLDMCVMPNHLHCILSLRTDAARLGKVLLDTDEEVGVVRSDVRDVMRWFKSVTTNTYTHGVREQGWKPFEGKLWQSRYYDHIIRNERELQLIRQYIRENPMRWEADCMNMT